eukprot:TRINITY_DN159_c2_g1_i1.p1 TRINITY_DN159_c2_g1~~TRINITY_DN159_c2_g1_i1.p1  ORF type:complete len:330 (-),score=49.32 TRINITY_DN159_c2_g1_i1:292-1221(-)
MKFLLLAAGFGTRLERDIQNDKSGKYALLKGKPKPLVPLADKPLISYWLDALRLLKLGGSKCEDILVVTNGAHYDAYVSWAKSNNFPSDNILNDRSSSNESRKGAIVDILFAIQTKKIKEDLLIVGGDTLFYSDFALEDVIQISQKRKQSVVLWYPCPDQEVSRTGILLSDTNEVVTGFLEKPKSSDTQSRKACPCFYLYRSEVLPLIQKYVDECKQKEKSDAPGNLLPWLCTRTSLHSYRISGRFDIGNLDSYIIANNYFSSAKTVNSKKENYELKKEKPNSKDSSSQSALDSQSSCSSSSSTSLVSR